MAAIEKINESYKKGFVELVSIDDKLFNLLVENISKLDLTFHPLNLVKKLTSSTEANFGDIESIFRSISRLITIKDQENVSSEAIINDICNIIKSGQIKELTYNETIDKKLRERLPILLENRQLFFASKSLDLLTEYENIFVSARIITDVRPIFPQNIEKPLEVGMITHLLHIHYHYGDHGDHKDIYLALDSDDLKSLKESVERAYSKTKILHSILEKSDITDLKIGE